MKKYDIIVIGGGAAGLAAAVSARWADKNKTICIVEKGERAARKIHATGNGRCNFTNTDIKTDCFFGDREFIRAVLNSFGYAEAAAFFERLGIKSRVEDGRVYPLSNQASAIAECLRLYLVENRVDFLTETPAAKIEKKNGLFYVGGMCAERVIVATGGKASPKLGSDGSGYSLLTDFGHKLTPLKPALVSLRTNNEVTKTLKGVKVFARAALYDGKRCAAADMGEVLFTDYGVSGIPVMQISRFAKPGMTLEIDMLPDLNEKEVVGEIYKRVRLLPEREGAELFAGLVNKKIAIPLLKWAKIEKTSVKAKNFTDENIRKCGEFLKSFKLKVLGDSGFENAQVTAGGIDTKDFCAQTMESKIVPGLYAAGEIFSVDAICGGYNLHWAWATGFSAGKNAAEN